MRFACWITLGYRHTHSEYVILIAFPRQQWIHERATILRYTYIACLILYALVFKLDMPIHDTHFSACITLRIYTHHVCLLFMPLLCMVRYAKQNITDCKVLGFKEAKIYIRPTVFWVVIV
jgi:hypothetical protein